MPFMVAGFHAEVSMCRAFERPGVRLGQPGRMCATLALLIFIFFGILISSYSQLPLSTGAPYVGQKAPSFTLPDQHGRPVSLVDLLKLSAGAKGKSGVLVLIFYRGYW
jgi:cytochrome oxidase Cu insertion factor (SCO1/SenC/PrrC family)